MKATQHQPPFARDTFREVSVSDEQRVADIEALAKMAARLAGRDPDKHVRMELGQIVAFDDLMWRYPDFLTRAEAAYDMLLSYPLARTP